MIHRLLVASGKAIYFQGQILRSPQTHSSVSMPFRKDTDKIQRCSCLNDTQLVYSKIELYFQGQRSRSHQTQFSGNFVGKIQLFDTYWGFCRQDTDYLIPSKDFVGKIQIIYSLRFDDHNCFTARRILIIVKVIIDLLVLSRYFLQDPQSWYTCTYILQVAYGNSKNSLMFVISPPPLFFDKNWTDISLMSCQLNSLITGNFKICRQGFLCSVLFCN